MIWLAFRALPLLGKLAAIVAVITGIGVAYGVWHHKIYMKGWKAHEAAIARQDEKAIEATKRARSRLTECRARGLRWEQSTGECVGG